MSIEKCLAGRVAAGEITDEQARDALAMVRQKQLDLKGGGKRPFVWTAAQEALWREAQQNFQGVGWMDRESVAKWAARERANAADYPGVSPLAEQRGIPFDAARRTGPAEDAVDIEPGLPMGPAAEQMGLDLPGIGTEAFGPTRARGEPTDWVTDGPLATFTPEEEARWRETLEKIRGLGGDPASYLRPDESVDDMATLAVVGAELKKEAQRKAQKAAMQGMAQLRVDRIAQQHPGGVIGNRGAAGKAYHGLLSQLVVDRTLGAKWESIEQLADGYRRAMQGMFDKGIEAMRSKMAGLKNETPAMRDFVREVFGQNSGSAGARASAAAWNDMIKWAVGEWRRLGGELDALDNWRVPQSHDSVRIKDAGYARWSDDVRRMIEEGKVSFVDWKLGGELPTLQRERVMRSMYETITTQGANKIVPGQRSRPKLAHARNERRAMQFVTPDGWLEYHNTYGPGESQIFDMLTSYIDGMGRDLALVKWGGPNPHHTFAVALDKAQKAGITDHQANFLRHAWDTVTAESFSPVSDTLARVGGEVRSFLSAAQLGGAFLSAIGADHLSAGMTAAFNGMSGWRTMMRYLSAINPADPEHRLAAWRAGLGAEAQTNRFQGAARHQLEMARGIGGKLAETVMRGSLLAHHTNALQHAIGWEFLGSLADSAGRRFDQLDGRQRRFFERYGIDARGWDIARTNLVDAEGLPILDPSHLVRMGGDASDVGIRLMGAIAAEQRIATPNPGAYERALMMRGSRPGTPVGEALSFFWQYKGFGVSVLTQHVLRGISQMRREGKYWYLPGFFAGTVLMGGLALQLKSLAQGKDLRDTDAKFWAAAAYQGGGWGIWGDFLYNGLSRADASMYLTLMGPGATLAKDVTALGLGNAGEAFREKDTNFGRELARFMRSYTPGSSLWYTRLATERWVWNSLQEWLDPRYRESFRRTESRAWQEQGVEFWWRPGSASPSRPPNLGSSAH